MLLGGDEFRRTQQGNNNAYCQDNEISWVHWDLDDSQEDLLEFTRRLIQLRQAHPVFRRRSFFQGRPIRGKDVKDLTWLHPEGDEMTDHQWRQDYARCLGLLVYGAGLDDRDEQGRPVRDRNFLVLLNAHHEEVAFRIPAPPTGGDWHVVLDTTCARCPAPDRALTPGNDYPLPGRALIVLMQDQEQGEE